MFWEIILPIFRSTRLFVTVCGIMHPRCCRPVAGNIVGAFCVILDTALAVTFIYIWLTCLIHSFFHVIACIMSMMKIFLRYCSESDWIPQWAVYFICRLVVLSSHLKCHVYWVTWTTIISSVEYKVMQFQSENYWQPQKRMQMNTSNHVCCITDRYVS